MAGIPHPHRCDVWEPIDAIETSGAVDTPTYHLAQSDLPANFQSRGRAVRFLAGADTTRAGCRLFLYGTRLKPSDRALFVNVAEGVAWRADETPNWKQALPSTGHFEADLTLELSPPDEVAALYPE